MTYVLIIMMLVARRTWRRSRTFRSYHFVGRFSYYVLVPLEGHTTGVWYPTHAQRKLLVLGVTPPHGETVDEMGFGPGQEGVPDLLGLVKGKK